MADLTERVAYLQGLASGFGDGTHRRDQVVREILDVLGAVADRVTALEEAHQELESWVESLDEDLAEIEDDFYVSEQELEGAVCPLCGAEVEVKEGKEGTANCPECGYELKQACRDGARAQRPEGGAPA